MTTSFRANFKKVSNECKSILEKPRAQTLKRTNFIIVMDSAIQLQSTTAVAPFCRPSPFFGRTTAPHDITWRTHDTSRTWLNHIWRYPTGQNTTLAGVILLPKVSKRPFRLTLGGTLGISQVRALRRRSAAHVGRKSSVLSLVSNWYGTKSAPMAQQGSPLTQTLRHPISKQW